MLTGDLVRARVRGRELLPQFVDAERADLLEPVAEMVDVTAMAVDEGQTLGELEEALDACIGDHRSHKVLRGIRKLLLDRCDVEVDAPLPPVELRARVFALAREMGPLALERDDTPDHHDALHRTTASDVFARVAAELDTTAAVVSGSLYGDLKQAQVVRAWRAIEPQALLHRYNVALVQALLLKAHEVRVSLHAPSVPRLRQLLRFAKFHQLMHRVERDDDVLVLVLDGPASLLQQSTRYGLNLAGFFPAVLLQECAWSVQAEVPWTKARHVKALEITHEAGLVSHYADTGAYTAREVTWFEERWEAQAATSPWTMRPATAPIDLGGRGVILPDFTFTDGTRTAHLEIVGFWRRDWLERRIDGLVRHGPGNLVLAVSRKLAAAHGEALDDVPGEVIPFAQVVPVKDVVAALERVAR
ncbi:MAG: DUF790 family protein [Alphaproteobacteria bacterium]|nr:DUF790 family protein [Alphaproteobacteria bacterium]